MSPFGLKSSNEDATPISLTGSIVTERSTGTIADGSFAAGAFRFSKGFAVSGEPDVIARSDLPKPFVAFPDQMERLSLKRTAHPPRARRDWPRLPFSINIAAHHASGV